MKISHIYINEKGLEPFQMLKKHGRVNIYLKSRPNFLHNPSKEVLELLIPKGSNNFGLCF